MTPFQIETIKLLIGSRADTGTTGQGCFMNVVAYLNGEPQITDQSECVCPSVRPIAIWLNDMANDEQRQQLLPFVLRAMGSATKDRAEIMRRLGLVVAFAKDVAARAGKYAASAGEAAASAGKYAAYSAGKYAASAGEAAASAGKSAALAGEYAARAGKYAAWAGNCAASAGEIFDRGMALLDAMLPPAEPASDAVVQRAKNLAALAV